MGARPRTGPRIFGEPLFEEAIRHRVVLLCSIIYWLLIFEGALRKWALPQISSILFFIRDPFLLAAYWYALRSTRLEGRNWLTGAAILAVVFAYLACAQALTIGTPLLTLAYGWRNYFLYVPLCFVILTHFRADDVDRLIRQTLLIAVPLAGLVAVQFASPPDAWINKGLASEGAVFMVAADIVRTYGTFTFTFGQALYAGSLTGFLLAAVMRSGRTRRRSVLLAVSAAALAVTLLLSGSRTAFVLAAMTVIVVVGAGAFARRAELRARMTLLPVVLAIVTAVLFPVVFPRSFEAMSIRQQQAVAAEGATELRALGTLTSVADVIASVPVLGAGLGFGTVGGSALATGQLGFTLAEDEWPRVVQEVGPILGPVYLLFRIAVAGMLVVAAFRALRCANDPTAACLLTLPAYLLFSGPTTFQGTANGYAWLLAGLTLAAARTAGRGEQDAPIAGQRALAGGSAL